MKKIAAMIRDRSMYGFLIAISGISVLSLSVLLILPSITTMANAQTSSSDITSGYGGGMGTNDKQRMGACVIGLSSPCNGDR